MSIFQFFLFLFYLNRKCLFIKYFIKTFQFKMVHLVDAKRLRKCHVLKLNAAGYSNNKIANYLNKINPNKLRISRVVYFLN